MGTFNLIAVLTETMPERNAILTITYVVVVFSILVQGLSVGLFTRRWIARTMV